MMTCDAQKALNTGHALSAKHHSFNLSNCDEFWELHSLWTTLIQLQQYNIN